MMVRTTPSPRHLAAVFLCCIGFAYGACSPAGINADAQHVGPNTDQQVPPPGNPNELAGANTDEPATAAMRIAAGKRGGPNNNYTLVGRFDTSQPDRVAFSFPNSKVGVRFTGTSVSALWSTTGDDTFEVVIDSALPLVITLPNDNSKQTTLLATGLANRSHTVWISKRTEANATANDGSGSHTGTTTFYGVDVGTGTFLTPPGTEPYLIEAIGDSAFSGYGSLGNVAQGANSCVFTPSTESATISTPALLAKALGAEVVNISAAGKGVASSLYNPDPTAQLPSVYLRTVQPNNAPAWDFSDPPIAAVVLQLGANDLSAPFGAGQFADTTHFINVYADLLATVRAHRPNAAIVCVVTAAAYAADKQTLRDAYQAAVAIRVAAGDLNVFVYDYFDNDPNGWTWYGDADYALQLGTGCEGHPNQKGAQFLADRLATFVRTVATFK